MYKNYHILNTWVNKLINPGKLITLIILSFILTACQTNQTTNSVSNQNPLAFKSEFNDDFYQALINNQETSAVNQVSLDSIGSEDLDNPGDTNYISLAEQINNLFKQQFNLTDVYMLAGQYQAASQLLNHYEAQSLDARHRQQWQLLQAKLALLAGNPKQALTWLNSVHLLANTPIKTRLLFDQLKIQAQYRTNQPFSSVLSEVRMLNLLAEQVDNQDQITQTAIWPKLMAINYSRVKSNFPHQTNPNIKQWLSLAMIAKHYANHFSSLIDQLAQWQQQYHNQSATGELEQIQQLINNAIANSIMDYRPYYSNSNSNSNPDQTNNTNIQLDTAQHIAVLLPLTGQYAALGQAVQLGIIDQYYQNKTKNIKNTTSLPSQNQQLRFYNTDQQNMAHLYQQVVSEHNDFIIGPLTKPAVASIAKAYDGTMPILSLNYLVKNNLINNSPNTEPFYQFGLAPADEAQQVAQLAWRLGKSKALIIAQADPHGQELVQQFTQAWTKLGGKIIDQYDYNLKNPQLRENLAKHLGIADSKWRQHLLNKTLGTSSNMTPYRRQDIDMIFLVANPASARQIKPLLKFYYASDIPVFATASVYSGVAHDKLDRDLNGIYFCDTTWLLDPTATMQTEQQYYQQIWGENFQQNNRLHSLGADAYLLSQQQAHLALLPSFPIIGATGNITVNQQHRLIRQLPCAQFVHGIPHVVH